MDRQGGSSRRIVKADRRQARLPLKRYKDAVSTVCIFPWLMGHNRSHNDKRLQKVLSYNHTKLYFTQSYSIIMENIFIV